MKNFTKLFKFSRRRAGTVIGVSANISAMLSVLIQPFLPDSSSELQRQLNSKPEINILTENFHCLLPSGHKIGEPKPLFQKIEPSLVEEFRKKYGGRQVSPVKESAAELETKVTNQVRNKDLQYFIKLTE